MDYQLNKSGTITRIRDGSQIPQEALNMDYVEYLKWLEEGNEPIPAAEDDPQIATRKIWPTVADFYAEFSTTEKYLIQSSTVPSIVVARGDLAMWRGEMWSDNPDVLVGLDAMIEAKVITPERKAEILTK